MHTSLHTFLYLSLISLILPAMQQPLASSRLVVTFKTREDNVLSNADLINATLVKRYGRRLVLDLHRPFDLHEEEGGVRSVMLAVESVEVDYLVSVGGFNNSIDDLNSLTADNIINNNSPIIPLTQWNLKDSEPYSIHVEKIWATTNSTPDVVVAVIDTGLARTAREYFFNLVDGYDFISDSDLALDGDGRDVDATDPGDWGDFCPTPSWHGTRVASILAARHNNKFGMRGIAQNCSVIPIRVLGLCKMGYASDITDAIVWAAGGNIDGVPLNPIPARILSLSLAGQGDCPSYLQTGIDLAVSLGSVVIAAAGNNNRDVVGYFPANCRNVITVAASTRQGTLAGYSNYGTLVNFSAPGGDSMDPIMTLKMDPMELDLLIAYGTGTSFAVPHVAGVFAMAPNILYRFTPQVSNCVGCGKGIISPYASIIIPPIIIPPPLIPDSTSNSSRLAGGAYLGGLTVTQICQPGTYPDDDETVKWTKNPIPTGVNMYNFQCPKTQFIGSIYKYSICGVGIQIQCVYRDGSIGFTSGCIGSGGCVGCSTVEISYGAPRGIAYTTGGYYIITLVYLVGQLNIGVESERVFTDVNNYGGPSNVEYCPNASVAVGLYGEYTPAVQSARIICRKMCPLCLKGYYCPNGLNMLFCPAGTYSDALGVSACTMCPAGTYSFAVSASSLSACISCLRGYYCPGGSIITPCPEGTYYDLTGASTSSTCTACPAGTYSVSSGASTQSVCLLCGLGTFSDSAASTLCRQCYRGTFADATGKTGCSGCLPGTYSSSGLSACIDCPVNTYTADSYTEICHTCSDTTCIVGQRIQTCTKTTNGGCQDCATPPINSGWMPGVCIWACIPDYYQNGALCSLCSALNLCGIGTYFVPCTSSANSKCNACTLKPLLNSDYTTTSIQGDSCDWVCNAGFYRSGSICTACAAGTYSSVAGLTASCPICATCAKGLWNSGCGGTTVGVCTTCSNSWQH